jgi:hypothetical protein
LKKGLYLARQIGDEGGFNAKILLDKGDRNAPFVCGYFFTYPLFGHKKA